MPLHVGDDFFGHPNGAVPTSFLLLNLVRNHLAIGLFLDHIGGAIAFVPPVGLGVDEKTLDCELLFVLFIRKSRWTPSQASSPCLHGYLEKVGHFSLCLCPSIYTSPS